jgi:hypothetical protein
VAKMGRPAVFTPKDPKARYQGLVTREGGRQLEAARKKLAALASLPVKSVSDGDVFEYLARGEEETKSFLSRT